MPISEPPGAPEIFWHSVLDLPVFPDPRLAAEHGLLAVGGDYRPSTLLAAYAQGIFPWPSDELSRAWFSPDPRMVLEPRHLRVSRSLRRFLRKQRFEVTYDTDFEAVIRACAEVPRPGQRGTWIEEEMIAGYLELHRLGFAHSAETRLGGELVGGLYGVSLGAFFSGESMFFRRTNASKVAFVDLVRRLEGWDFQIVDCQVYTEHLAAQGARLWPRNRFLDALERALEQPTRRGSWAAE